MKISLISSLCLYICVSLPVFTSGCSKAGNTFVILSGHEHSFLEERIMSFGEKQGVLVRFIYKGDPEIAARICSPDPPYDAVWPLHRIWLDLGDDRGRVTGDTSIMYSPVAAGVDVNLVSSRNLTGKKILFKDLLTVKTGRLPGPVLKFSHPVHSGSGAAAAVTVYNRIVPLQTGKKISFTRLNEERLISSDIIITTEAEIIRINRQLEKKGRPLRRIIYPGDMLLIADSPLGLFSKSKSSKGAFFEILKNYLLSKEMQKFIIGKGRRSPLEEHLQIESRDLPSAPGLKRNSLPSPCRLPTKKEFLAVFKKLLSRNKNASRCALLLDFSQSMKEGGRDSIMKTVVERLTTSSGPVRLYEPAGNDTLTFIPFSHIVRDEFTSPGNDRELLSSITVQLQKLEPRGATSFYGAILHGLERVSKDEKNHENISVLLVTDGANNTGISFEGFRGEYREKYSKIPVHIIYFPNADRKELEKVAALTGGRLFEGREQTGEACKTILGYQ